jgi:hypothetical protein
MKIEPVFDYESSDFLLLGVVVDDEDDDEDDDDDEEFKCDDLSEMINDEKGLILNY